MDSLHILVVNLDNLALTKDCLMDLMRQLDAEFDLTIIDNQSSEPGTEEYFKFLRSVGLNAVRYDNRKPLNHIWNDFYKENKNEYLCFLNNDVRLSKNFTKTIREVFKKEPDIAIVGHVTNNPEYVVASDELNYAVEFKNMRQGWDWTIRRECYVPIPDSFQTYFGDDWIYNKVYESGKKAATILNSPMVHFMGSTGKKVKQNTYWEDRKKYLEMGYKENYSSWPKYCIIRPQHEPSFYLKENYRPLITINLVTYGRYEETKEILRMLKDQTDTRFIVDIWQDGPDEKKKEIVESFNDNRFIYNENPVRENKYGHDMRHKSLLKCSTPWWSTTNDDNYMNTVYVERILGNIETGIDVLKHSVAMLNLPKRKIDKNNLKSLFIHGYVGMNLFENDCKVLDPDKDILGDVDAASFVVRPDVLLKLGGWDSHKFEGDWVVYEKMLKKGLKIKKIKEVLVGHL